MPEHFHGIIWVHERLRAPLGEVVRSFKIACTKANLALETPIIVDGSTTFWFPGLYDTILFGNRGGVIVSGCISPGEQAVARAVREAGLPLIAIIPHGFGPYFKPSGAYFDACADGKLLMLSPFPQITKAEKLTRDRCFGINAVAAALCGEDPSAIRYRGSQPGQFAP